MFKGDFLDVFRKHSLFLTNSEDEAARSGGQAESGANGEPGERPEDPETAQGSGAAMDDTSAGVALGEATGNSSSAETGLGNLPEAGNEETKGL
jgi:hypothetical protein